MKIVSPGYLRENGLAAPITKAANRGWTTAELAGKLAGHFSLAQRDPPGSRLLDAKLTLKAQSSITTKGTCHE